ncbi:hypothetical protein ROHU_008557 [Labeo rohita]|uniref:Uncharacterized protein n=1 Tax=Labeo rohita TaxID=84645 RepID=A0A498L942_LABRO|nr:hypothetical protein ROHU_013415 [Labeo rohita]RXN15935.1 hypothetical protein ROHU_008557 [Labeo rohita]
MKIISNETSYKTFILTVHAVPDPGLSSGAVALICIVLLIAAAAVVLKYSRPKFWRFGPQGSLIAKIPLRNKETLPEDDERFTTDLLYGNGETNREDAVESSLEKTLLIWKYSSISV